MIDAVSKSLAQVTHPRFYDTERGFQGEFLAALRANLPSAGLPGDAVVEQEYQKRLREHGIRIRPDLIVHVPTPELGDRRRGNFLVCEFKLSATADEAREDFESLDAVMGALNYPIGVFVNIRSHETHAAAYAGPFTARLHCFAVWLHQGHVQLTHAAFNGERFVEVA